MSESLLQRMIRKLHEYRRVGAEPELFIAGKSTIAELDRNTDKLVALYRTNTRGRKVREVVGVPVIASRTARTDCLELIVRRGSGPATVEPLR